MMWARNGLRVAAIGLASLLCLPSEAAPSRARRPPQQPPIVLQLSPCLAAVVDESELRRLLAIELGATLRSAPGQASSVQLLLDCSDGNPQLADLSLEDAATGSASLRTVDLSTQAPPVRARLLALALAELVQTHSPEREPESPAVASPARRPSAASPHRSSQAPTAAQTTGPAPETGQPSRQPAPTLPASALASPPAAAAALPTSEPTTPALTASRPQPDGLYIQAGFALLLPFALQPPPLHVGGGLRLGGDHRHHLGWDFDAQAQMARRRTALGELSSDLLSSRVSLQAHVALWALRLRAGLGLRVGATRLGGTPSDAMQTAGQERWAPFGGPLLATSVTLAPASLRRLRIDLSAEGGYLLWTATARVDGKPALAIAGPWLGLALSVGLSLGRIRR